MPHLRRRPAALPAAAVVAVLLGVPACTPSSGPEPAATDDADERIATVLALRSAAGPPAAELGSAAATVTQQLADLRAALPVDPADRVAAAGELRDGALARLEDARDAVGPELAGDADGPDADAVRAALGDAVDAADALLAAATEDLVLLERAADADARLVRVVAAWEEPGSRNEQLGRLAEVAAEADTLAAELGPSDDVPGCSDAVARRARAAEAMADASRELRGLVERRRGEEFDARRAELASDPAASTRALVEADRGELDCWREESPVVARAAEVAGSLEELEAALNPSDLASPGRS